MRLIPVLDLRDGQAIRGVGGHRHQYAPLRSVWHEANEPIAIARALVERYGLDTLYLADLDGIERGTALDPAIIQGIQERGMGVWVDPGVRDRESAREALSSGVDGLVIGLETLVSRGELSAILEEQGADRILFSLDLRCGKPLTRAGADWGTEEAEDIAAGVIERGLRRMIVLDLDRIGRGEGPGTEDLIWRIRGMDRGLEIYSGGGIRGVDDVTRLAEYEVAGLLVGKALWEGDLDELLRSGRARTTRDEGTEVERREFRGVGEVERSG